jgi:hypothetical protein
MIAPLVSYSFYFLLHDRIAIHKPHAYGTARFPEKSFNAGDF